MLFHSLPTNMATNTQSPDVTIYAKAADPLTPVVVQYMNEHSGCNVTTTYISEAASDDAEEGLKYMTVQQTDSNDGNSSTFTVDTQGNTTEQIDSNNGNSSTFIVNTDGSSIETQNSNNGNTSSVVVSPDGTITTEVSQSNGSSENTVVNADGSTYSFATASNGKITIVTVDVNGVEIEEVYFPWQNTYTRTTTPPGTVETISPNPYSS